MKFPPSLRDGPRQDDSPQPGVLPKTVTVRIEWPGGQVREYRADNPSGFWQVIAPSGHAAGLPAGFGAHPEEPVVAVMFAGNPAAGGIRVASAGKL